MAHCPTAQCSRKRYTSTRTCTHFRAILPLKLSCGIGPRHVPNGILPKEHRSLIQLSMARTASVSFAMQQTRSPDSLNTRLWQISHLVNNNIGKGIYKSFLERFQSKPPSSKATWQSNRATDEHLCHQSDQESATNKHPLQHLSTRLGVPNTLENALSLFDASHKVHPICWPVRSAYKTALTLAVVCHVCSLKNDESR